MAHNAPKVAQQAEVLVAQTIANRSPLRRILHQARRAGRIVADTAGVAAVVKSKTQLGDELEIAFQPGLAARDPMRYLDYALALPSRIAEVDGKQVVVFFDEFQEIASPNAPYGDPDRLAKRMRAIFQRQTGVSYLFAGSLEHLMRDLFVPRQRAQKSHLTAVLLETDEIDLAVVEQGYLTALQGERINHEQTVERIRQTHKLGLEIARRIARGAPVYPGLPRGAVRRALEHLETAAVIETGGRAQWHITDPLLRRYLATSSLCKRRDRRTMRPNRRMTPWTSTTLADDRRRRRRTGQDHPLERARRKCYVGHDNPVRPRERQLQTGDPVRGTSPLESAHGLTVTGRRVSGDALLVYRLMQTPPEPLRRLG